MDALEQAKLKAALPAHLIYEETSPEGPVIHDLATENVTVLVDCSTAAEAIAAVVHDARAFGRREGKSDMQMTLKKLLGVDEDIRTAVTTAVHASIR